MDAEKIFDVLSRQMESLTKLVEDKMNKLTDEMRSLSDSVNKQNLENVRHQTETNLKIENMFSELGKHIAEDTEHHERLYDRSRAVVPTIQKAIEDEREERKEDIKKVIAIIDKIEKERIHPLERSVGILKSRFLKWSAYGGAGLGIIGAIAWIYEHAPSVLTRLAPK